MNVEPNSPYNTRYIRILGWTSFALGIATFMTAIIIHATPNYPDYYNPDQGMVSFFVSDEFVCLFMVFTLLCFLKKTIKM